MGVTGGEAVTGSYATGRVTGRGVVGGLVGNLLNYGTDNDGMALEGGLVASFAFTTQGETLGPGVGEALAHVYPNPAARCAVH